MVEQLEHLKQEVQRLSAQNAEQHQKLLSVNQELSSRIEALLFELGKLTSELPVHNSTITGMYGYIEAISLASLSDSQKSRLDSGLRSFLNGGVPLTEPVGLEGWSAFSDRFIKFLGEVGLQVQINWLGFDYNDTTKTDVNAYKLQALHLYHANALQSPDALRWYISSRTVETFRMLCLARGLL